ncbi:ATP-binding protein [Actinomadura sp. 9N407]|uniref:ATP-binding protein n=1 Tax=Actinomadura sp. 9N407 TaxID=3375154 RepID=UPI0037B73E02
MMDAHSAREIYTDRAEVPQTETPTIILESTDKAPLQARRFVAEIFAKWDIPDDYLARVVVSELVTNAYRYGQGTIIVRLSVGARDGLLLLEVYDSGDGQPTVLPENHASTGGRGLPTIADITAAWGVRPIEGGGKVVWARLAP